MIWDFILNRVPWQLQAAIIAVPVGLVFLIVGNIIGWEKVRKFILPALGFIGALALLSRARQGGYNAREERGKKETEIAIKQADEARARADERNADPERLRDDDGHKRRNKPGGV